MAAMVRTTTPMAATHRTLRAMMEKVAAVKMMLLNDASSRKRSRSFVH
jgi:hypothetical protein